VIWYTADPLGTGGQGWFGRFLDHGGCFGATDVPGVVLGGDLTPMFTPTGTSLLAFRRLSELRFPASGDVAAKQAAFQALYDASNDVDPALFPELVALGNTGVAAVQKMQDYYLSGGAVGKVEALLVDAEGGYDADNDLVYPSPLNPSTNPLLAGNDLARDLKHVAATIRADVGARFFHVQTGGFDSHSQQERGFYHSFLLQGVSEAVAAFHGEVSQSVTLPGGYTGYQTGDVSPRVVVVVFSEFGRTIRQNAPGINAGTDHAAPSVVLVTGGAVAGGQYGAYPLLDDPGENDDDLRMTFDFRDVFGTVLTRHLGVAEADVGPGPGKILPATPEVDPLGNSYTSFTPIPFLP